MSLPPGAAAAAALSLVIVAERVAADFDPADPIVAPIEIGPVEVRLEEIAGGLTAPNLGLAAPGVPTQLYVVDQAGRIVTIDLDTQAQRVFLDVGARLVPLGASGPGSGDERGLLGLAFHPGYAANGLVYTYTSEPVAGSADFSTIPDGAAANHQSVIIEWRVPDPANPDAVVDTSSARELLRLDQPQANHNAGALLFDADERLYIALGDGGGAGDAGPGHGEAGNGQDLSSPLGSILRIDPAGEGSANGRYGIPPDNPFFGGPEVQEIWAWGLRNPFRMSFDRDTGELWLADAGQRAIEEIDRASAGDNFGWNHKEGSFFFAGDSVTDVDPGVPAGLVDPVAEYDHDEGVAVVGGFVYRGSAIPALAGRYVFGDFAGGGAGSGRLFYLDEGDVIRGLDVGGGSDATPMTVNGFGEDAAGELYVMGNATGRPFGETGRVLRLTPVEGPPASGGEPTPPAAPPTQGDGGGGAASALLAMAAAVALRRRFPKARVWFPARYAAPYFGTSCSQGLAAGASSQTSTPPGGRMCCGGRSSPRRQRAMASALAEPDTRKSTPCASERRGADNETRSGGGLGEFVTARAAGASPRSP